MLSMRHSVVGGAVFLSWDRLGATVTGVVERPKSGSDVRTKFQIKQRVSFFPGKDLGRSGGSRMV